jgi:hypothetical protein
MAPTQPIRKLDVERKKSVRKWFGAALERRLNLQQQALSEIGAMAPTRLHPKMPSFYNARAQPASSLSDLTLPFE